MSGGITFFVSDCHTCIGYKSSNTFTTHSYNYTIMKLVNSNEMYNTTNLLMTRELVHAIAVTCELKQKLLTIPEQSINLFSDPEQAETLDHVRVPLPTPNLEKEEVKYVTTNDVLTMM